MSEKREVIVFDDGSINAALIQYELKNNKDYDFDIDVVKVDPKDPVVEWFTKVDPKDAKRIYLPFDTEDLVADNEKIRIEVNNAKELGFENLIVLPYDGQDKKYLKHRARSKKVTDREFNVIREFKVKDQVPEGAGVPTDADLSYLSKDETNEKFKTSSKYRDRKVSDLQEKTD